MQVNIFTLFWSALALLSIFSLYFFNHGRSFLTFITSRKYLLLLIVASLLGMRQMYLEAVFICLGTLLLMWVDYKPYIETCRRLKRAQEQKTR